MAQAVLTQLSKFLSLILRHRPETIGLTLDPEGWAVISELLEKARPHSRLPLSRALLTQLVVSSDKQRFQISADGLRIRAQQGHSIPVDLKLSLQSPPARLYHGTASRFLASILREGLKAGQRHHVHLSTDIATATAVGRRYGQVVLLQVEVEAMQRQGYEFFRSGNGVWLTLHVPPQFLRQLNGAT